MSAIVDESSPGQSGHQGVLVCDSKTCLQMQAFRFLCLQTIPYTLVPSHT